MNISKFVKSAIELAKINSGKTSPNPWVGCIVAQDGKIVGKGFHKGAGFPHAEIEAIEEARKRGANLKECELFVSLQPCNTYGRTPPCTDYIRKVGIKKTYFSVFDPAIDQKNYSLPNSQGGILKSYGKKVLLPYLIFKTEKRPYVIVKLAQTIDGKIADIDGNSKYISSQKSIEYVHRLRSRVNFILVGEKTLIKDNPHLNVRNLPASEMKKIEELKREFGNSEFPNPVKIIVDSDLSCIEKIENLNIMYGNNTIVITKARLKDKSSLKPKNLSVITYPKSKSKSEYIPPEFILDTVYNLGGMILLIEGGGETAWQFIKNELFDEIWIFISPRIFGGGKSIGESHNNTAKKLGKEIKVNLISIQKIDQDILLKYSKRNRIWEF